MCFFVAGAPHGLTEQFPDNKPINMSANLISLKGFKIYLVDLVELCLFLLPPRGGGAGGYAKTGEA